MNAVSTSDSGKNQSGRSNCAPYTSADASTPVTTHTSTVASRMLRLGLCTSSDSVEMPSKPM